VAPENIRFRSWLEGWEESWSEASGQRSISFSRLPPGRYQFHVTACSSAGVWNQAGASLAFQIPPFFWQTWSFRAGAALVVLAGFAFGVRSYERRRTRLRLEQLERRHEIERERARIARDIHDELGAGLVQIGLLADMGAAQTATPETGKAQFSRIALRARSAGEALEQIVWAANPHNDNLPRLADFLSQLADDCFEAGSTRCRKDVPTHLPDVTIRAEIRHNVALAVKEALTNATRHANAKTVWLRLRWTAPDLVIEIEDDGQGFHFDAQAAERLRSSGHNGIANQFSRMKDIGGSVRVQSTPGVGTRITLQLSLAPSPETPKTQPSATQF
jgi:signal transduction histidine kinase